MNGVLEAKAFETETDDEAVEVVVVVTTADDLKELARRCRELLAKQTVDEDRPPGHWLG